ncbi:hypothetical protein MMC12_006588 [Toensbergia leucococca]|nr:hypothetical protein [Toensbergia leucococca]
MLYRFTVGMEHPPIFTIVGLSYRGFWTSSGRPSQSGIELDADAALAWVARKFNTRLEDIRVVLWGQSIGAGVATNTASRYYRKASGVAVQQDLVSIDGLLLETPFVSIRHMLRTLYPQFWLPYRYLGPFLRNHWDSRKALQQIGMSKVKELPRILILQAGKDELVPPEHGVELNDLCKELGMDVQRREISGALHTEIVAKKVGRESIAKFLKDFGKSEKVQKN